MGRVTNSVKRGFGYEIGKNAGKVVSNMLFGDKHSTPIRINRAEEREKVRKYKAEELKRKSDLKLKIEREKHDNQMQLLKEKERAKERERREKEQIEELRKEELQELIQSNENTVVRYNEYIETLTSYHKDEPIEVDWKSYQNLKNVDSPIDYDSVSDSLRVVEKALESGTLDAATLQLIGDLPEWITSILRLDTIHFAAIEFCEETGTNLNDILPPKEWAGQQDILAKALDILYNRDIDDILNLDSDREVFYKGCRLVFKSHELKHITELEDQIRDYKTSSFLKRTLGSDEKALKSSYENIEELFKVNRTPYETYFGIVEYIGSSLVKIGNVLEFLSKIKGEIEFTSDYEVTSDNYLSEYLFEFTDSQLDRWDVGNLDPNDEYEYNFEFVTALSNNGVTELKDMEWYKGEGYYTCPNDRLQELFDALDSNDDKIQEFISFLGRLKAIGLKNENYSAVSLLGQAQNLLSELQMEEANRNDSIENIKKLATSILNKDVEAYAPVLSDNSELSLLTRIAESGANFDFKIVDGDLVSIDVVADMEEIIPDERPRLVYGGKQLSYDPISQKERNDVYQDYICSMTLMSARELFAILPISKLDIRTSIPWLNSGTGNHENKTILKVTISRNDLDSLNFKRIDPSDCLEQVFNAEMDWSPTNGFSFLPNDGNAQSLDKQIATTADENISQGQIADSVPKNVDDLPLNKAVFQTDGSADKVEFIQQGTSVEATYPAGTLNGNLTGQVLVGTLNNTKANFEGQFQFTFDENFTSFKGKWKKGLSDGPLRGNWNGTKLS